MKCIKQLSHQKNKNEALFNENERDWLGLYAWAQKEIIVIGLDAFSL